MSEKALKGQLVLSLFPGGDLLGRAFEQLGACVVKGPDILQGGDIREFHALPGRFDGVIGGPPCQVFSAAAAGKSKALNLIPEFVRVVNEAQPQWAVMENVVSARRAAPAWDVITIRDWDVGGLTFRRRSFWFYGIAAPLVMPPKRPGRPEYSVLATSWKDRPPHPSGRNTKIVNALTPDEAARLQGFDGLGQQMVDGLPSMMPITAKRILAVHMLGNGVPLAMGRYIAQHVANSL